MTNQPWKLILLLLAIFMAGSVTGALLMRSVGRKMLTSRPMPEQWAPMHMRKLTERLKLQPEQVEQIKPIVRRNMEEVGELRTRSLAEIRTLFERMQREVAEKLSPEQRLKFDDFNRELRERALKDSQRKSGHSRSDDGRPVRPEKPPGAADQ